MTTSRPAAKKTTARSQSAEARAKVEGTTVKFKGRVFVIPRTEDWPIEAMDAFENSAIASFTRIILGDQYEGFREVAKTVGDLNEFFELAMSVGGSGTPE